MKQFDGGVGNTATRHYRTGSAVNGRLPGSTSTGSPEGRFLASAGKPLIRLVAELKERWAAALVRVRGTAAALDHALGAASERKAQHRGGDRPWPLRLII